METMRSYVHQDTRRLHDLLPGAYVPHNKVRQHGRTGIPLLFVPHETTNDHFQDRRATIGSHVQRVLQMQREGNKRRNATRFIESKPQQGGTRVRKTTKSSRNTPPMPTAVEAEESVLALSTSPHEGVIAPIQGSQQPQDEHLADQPSSEHYSSAVQTPSTGDSGMGTTAVLPFTSCIIRQHDLGLTTLPRTRRAGGGSTAPPNAQIRGHHHICDAQRFQPLSAQLCKLSTNELPLHKSLPPPLPVHDATGLIPIREMWESIQKCTLIPVPLIKIPCM